MRRGLSPNIPVVIFIPWRRQCIHSHRQVSIVHVSLRTFFTRLRTIFARLRTKVARHNAQHKDETCAHFFFNAPGTTQFELIFSQHRHKSTAKANNNAMALRRSPHCPTAKDIMDCPINQLRESFLMTMKSQLVCLAMTWGLWWRTRSPRPCRMWSVGRWSLDTVIRSRLRLAGRHTLRD